MRNWIRKYQSPEAEVETKKFQDTQAEIKRLQKELKRVTEERDILKMTAAYFKVREFACQDGSQVVFIDDYLIFILDILRNQVGKPVYINSGYRTPTRNKAVGGAKYSYHMRGMAADIRIEGMTAKEIARQQKK